MFSAESLKKFHDGHDCNPGKCVCRCGCGTEMGCTVLGPLCSVCHVRDVRGDDEHGMPIAPEVAAAAAYALSCIVHDRCQSVPHDTGLTLLDEVMKRFILIERE